MCLLSGKRTRRGIHRRKMKIGREQHTVRTSRLVQSKMDKYNKRKFEWEKGNLCNRGCKKGACALWFFLFYLSSVSSLPEEGAVPPSRPPPPPPFLPLPLCSLWERSENTTEKKRKGKEKQ